MYAAADLAGTMKLQYDVTSRIIRMPCTARLDINFILKALQDPSVNAIGHLTGRYVGRRPGVELDIDVILEALALTGVALEINGALDRLDATSEVVRRAMSAGVVVVIDTDSHHTRDLGRMEYGTRYAQRGWVTTDGVLNTRSHEDVLAFVAARRH